MHKPWTLHKLEPSGAGEDRWSVGEWGPRAYLTTDEETARLIAAAPELLEALRLAAQQLDYAAGSELADVNQQEADNCAERAMQARAAIAKATVG